MKNALYAAIALLVGYAGAPAASVAADLGDSFKDTPRAVAPAGDETPTFAGAYIGLSVNWSRMDVDHSGSLEGNGNEACEFCGLENMDRVSSPLPALDSDAVGFGVNAGYNVQIGRFYAGPLVTFDVHDHSESFTAGDIDPDLSNIPGKLTVENTWLAMVGGKLGFAVTDRVGIYVAGGLAFADIEVSTSVDGFEGASAAHDDTLTGYALGVGADIALSNNWRLDVNYYRYDFSDADFSGNVLDCLKYTYGSDMTLDIGRVGLTYRF
jgi:outer membrane immunogenic protein